MVLPKSDFKPDSYEGMRVTAAENGQLMLPLWTGYGSSDIREPYGDWVSAAKSTHLQKSYHILPKTEPNTYLKPSPCKASTHLNEKHRVWAIC
jgi:hypothetical protein